MWSRPWRPSAALRGLECRCRTSCQPEPSVSQAERQGGSGWMQGLVRPRSFPHRASWPSNIMGRRAAALPRQLVPRGHQGTAEGFRSRSVRRPAPRALGARGRTGGRTVRVFPEGRTFRVFPEGRTVRVFPGGVPGVLARETTRAGSSFNPAVRGLRRVGGVVVIRPIGADAPLTMAVGCTGRSRAAAVLAPEVTKVYVYRSRFYLRLG